MGAPCRANDIVVQRRDGGKRPLSTRAAPIDLHNTGKPDAAVWVLEDWSTIHQAEMALRESELRLRAVIETMGEGVIVQDDTGAIIDCNAAACSILRLAREALMNRRGLAPESGSLQENGAPFPPDQHPDRRALREQQPVRGVIVGLQSESGGEFRWLLVNSLPLPVGPVIGMNHQKARVVTTFADITLQLQAQSSLRQTRDKYQGLVESLPFMLQLRDKEFNITYRESAQAFRSRDIAKKIDASICKSIIHPDDWPDYAATADTVARRNCAGRGALPRQGYGTMKTVLSFVYQTFTMANSLGPRAWSWILPCNAGSRKNCTWPSTSNLVGRLASGTIARFQ